MLTAYFFLEKFRTEISQELNFKKDQILCDEEGFLALRGEAFDSIWAQQICAQAKIIDFQSIGEGAKKLLEISRGPWVNASVANHRRSTLIAEKLRIRKSHPIKFLDSEAHIKKNLFCLLDPQRLLYSENISPNFAQGQLQFVETKEAPSRAYLKLWELFTLHQFHPKSDEVCLDMGSSPGGWTWVLSELGCQVISVDKAPLDSRLINSKRIVHLKKDAFALDPKSVVQEFGRIDWFFSDVICEPERLVDLVEKWKSQSEIKNFVCTVKFKGQTDSQSLKRLMKYSGAQAKHLFHNKHEVTWVLRA